MTIFFSHHTALCNMGRGKLDSITIARTFRPAPLMHEGVGCQVRSDPVCGPRGVHNPRCPRQPLSPCRLPRRFYQSLPNPHRIQNPPVLTQRALPSRKRKRGGGWGPPAASRLAGITTPPDQRSATMFSHLSKPTKHSEDPRLTPLPNLRLCLMPEDRIVL